jgi:hypothetical protein
MTGVDALMRGGQGDWYEVNALDLAKHCVARGRYEVAREFHEVGLAWYERNVVKEPGASADDRKRSRQVLADYKAQLAELPLLVQARGRLLVALRPHHGGIDRNKLKGEVMHEGTTAFGVICNQLDRGGWLRQEKTGKAFLLYPIATPPASNAMFLKAEIPTPPAASLSGRSNPSKRPGCLPIVLAMAITAVVRLLSKG